MDWKWPCGDSALERASEMNNARFGGVWCVWRIWSEPMFTVMHLQKHTLISSADYSYITLRHSFQYTTIQCPRERDRPSALPQQCVCLCVYHILSLYKCLCKCLCKQWCVGDILASAQKKSCWSALQTLMWGCCEMCWTLFSPEHEPVY